MDHLMQDNNTNNTNINNDFFITNEIASSVIHWL
jgi:hypothetical protein